MPAATILVVDDEEGVRTVIARTLQGAGFDVLQAEHGEAALRVVRGFAGPLLLAVVDMNMPVMTGTEFAREFRPLAPACRSCSSPAESRWCRASASCGSRSARRSCSRWSPRSWAKPGRPSELVPRPALPDRALHQRAAELRQRAGLLRLQSLFLRLQGERLCGHSNDLLTIVMFRRETRVSRPEPPRATLALVS